MKGVFCDGKNRDYNIVENGITKGESYTCREAIPNCKKGAAALLNGRAILEVGFEHLQSVASRGHIYKELPASSACSRLRMVANSATSTERGVHL